MRKETKTLTFPLAGVSQSAVTRFQSRPYTAPFAVNVRSVCALEKRLRGGSRPGLAKITSHSFTAAISSIIPLTYIDPDGVRRHDLMIVAGGVIYVMRGTTAAALTPELETDAGIVILTEDGQEIVFDGLVTEVGRGDGNGFDYAERFGRIFLADAVLKEYNPNTGEISTVQATAGIIPSACPRICLYRDRLFLAGVDNTWYCSRMGEPTDWSFGYDLQDVGRAVVGQVGDAGHIGGVITAMIPWEDSVLTFATEHEIWRLEGDPVTGSLQQVSDAVGIISSGAWAISPDGTMAFLSYDGVYLMPAGAASEPQAFSKDRVPDLLINTDLTKNVVRMAYDNECKGFHLFITPDSGKGLHWWIDVENKAMWPVSIPDGMQPIAVSARANASALSDVIVGGVDGYLRKFDRTALNDDGSVIQSHVALGPVRVATNDILDGILNEIHGMLAVGSKDVEWKIVTGATSEEVSDALETNIRNSIDGGKISGVVASGTFRAGRNYISRCRCRGGWFGIWLTSRGRWAYEAVAVVTSQLGRLRYGY